MGQAFAGEARYNQELIASGLHPVTLWRYVTSSAFGVDVMENWQSEFLAVASMVVLSIFLRERGSSESKPVGAPHSTTAEEG